MAGTHIQQDESHDIVWGMPAIGRAINREPRAVEYLAKKHPDFPVKKIGGVYVASRKELVAFILAREEAA